jgi:hypothetical protein
MFDVIHETEKDAQRRIKCCELNEIKMHVKGYKIQLKQWLENKHP